MALFSLSHDSITRLFRHEIGVLIVCPPHRRGVRTKRTLRVPQHVVDRVYARLSVKGRPRVESQNPTFAAHESDHDADIKRDIDTQRRK
jgi:hypothetical protein